MTIEERPQLLEDERAILHALCRDGHGLDHDLADEYADVWTEDAVLAWPERPPRRSRRAVLDEPSLARRSGSRGAFKIVGRASYARQTAWRHRGCSKRLRCGNPGPDRNA